MAFWSNLFRLGEVVAETETRAPAFAGLSIDPGVLYGIPSWDWTSTRRVSRRDAIAVPAVKKARDLIANAIGGLELRLHDPNGRPTAWNLFEQPEADVATSVTWTRVAEDLLFEGIAWLRITHVGWHGYPTEVVRLEPGTVTVQPETTIYHSTTGSGSAQQWPTDPRLIRIDSPNDPLLVAGARAIRTLIALGETTDKAASALPPLAVFTPADGVDPAEPEEVQEVLTQFEEARRNGNPYGYVGAALKLQSLGWNPEQLQLTDLRNQAVLEIARISSVDPEELGVSTTSRVYANIWDRKQHFIEFTLKGYLRAIEGRLSMNSVTPRGFKARHDLDEFLKSDTLSRYQAYEIGLRTGAITEDEIRDSEGKPPLSPSQRAAITDAPKEIAS